MTKLILLVTLALVVQIVRGQTNPPLPVGTVTCHDNHTVDIIITNVDDLDEWNTTEWRLADDEDCEPTFDGTTVTYTGLVLPNCTFSSEQLNNSIKYLLKVSATKPNPMGGAGQLRAYDHLYDIFCDYDNQDNTSVASFVPIVNRGDNSTGNALFTFTLDVSTSDSAAVPPSGPIALGVPLYFTAEVVTQSALPNLDILPVSCWASSSSDPSSIVNRVTLITDGCGSAAVSEDVSDTLVYSCANNSKTETFSIQTFRYFGKAAGDSVYFHCTLRVCLADLASDACACPDDPAACTSPSAKRKRRSVNDFVEEVNVRAGPFTFVDDTEKEEVESEKQDEPQSFSTNLAIIVAVSGVVVVAVIVCATVFFVVRNRNKRRQDRDLNVVT